jgi:hypothetical protein
VGRTSSLTLEVLLRELPFSQPLLLQGANVPQAGVRVQLGHRPLPQTQSLRTDVAEGRGLLETRGVATTGRRSTGTHVPGVLPALHPRSVVDATEASDVGGGGKTFGLRLGGGEAPGATHAILVVWHGVPALVLLAEAHVLHVVAQVSNAGLAELWSVRNHRRSKERVVGSHVGHGGTASRRRGATRAGGRGGHLDGAPRVWGDAGTRPLEVRHVPSIRIHETWLHQVDTWEGVSEG